MKKSGLYIGRFQPFHKGHLDVIYKALKSVCTLTIVIGSSQAGKTWYNPCTKMERIDIISKALKIPMEDGRVKLYALNDIDDPAAWPRYVVENVGPHEVLFSGNIDGVVTLFKKAYPDMDIIMFGGQRISGTMIREHIVWGADISGLVHPTTHAYMHKHKIVERIKKIYYNGRKNEKSTYRG